MQLTYAAYTFALANGFHIADYNVIMGTWHATIQSSQLSN